MGIQNVLLKTEPTYFPFHVVKSDDGGGNLVAYDSGNPTTGWTAPMASPFSGLWLRVEFSDYYVNFKHNGTTWVEYNKEAKSGGSITLYSNTEADTGLTDELGDTIYCRTFTNITSGNLNGSSYTTNIPSSTLKKTIELQVQEYYYQEFEGDIFEGWAVFKNDNSLPVYAYSNTASSWVTIGNIGSIPVNTTLIIRIYYTKN